MKTRSVSVLVQKIEPECPSRISAGLFFLAKSFFRLKQLSSIANVKMEPFWLGSVVYKGNGLVWSAIPSRTGRLVISFVIKVAFS